MNWRKMLLGSLVLAIFYYFAVWFVTQEFDWINQIGTWKTTERILLLTTYGAIWAWTILPYSAD